MPELSETTLDDISGSGKSGKWKETVQDFRDYDNTVANLEDVGDDFENAYQGIRSQISSKGLKQRLAVLKRNESSDDNRELILVNIGEIKDFIRENMEDDDVPDDLGDMTGGNIATLKSLHREAQKNVSEDSEDSENED